MPNIDLLVIYWHLVNSVMKVRRKGARKLSSFVRHSTPIKIISVPFWQTATGGLILLVIAICQQQQFAFAAPPVYTSVRHQMPQRVYVPVVASTIPLAILSDPSLATRSSMQGSLFARPDENVKRAPQNDALAVAAIMNDAHNAIRRTARHIRVHRISDVNAMDRAINSRA